MIMINSIVNSVMTGDNTDTTPYLIIGGIALVVIIGFVVYKVISKKKKQ